MLSTELILTYVKRSEALQRVENELRYRLRPLTYGDGIKQEAIQEFCEYLLRDLESWLK